MNRLNRANAALWMAMMVGAAALSGCFYPADRGRALEARVDRLAGQNDGLETRIKNTQSQVSQSLESLDKASRRSDADIGVQLQKTLEDVSSLRGMVEGYQHRLGELESSIQKLTEENQKQFTELKGSEAVKAAEARRKSEELQRPSGKREFLELAQSKAEEGDAPLARQLYGEFLKKWPKDNLAASAHYGLGESFFGEDKCREALFEYGKVIQDFSKSRPVADAYLRSATCFEKLKMRDESKMALEELVKSYPKSDAARTAKSRLAELERGDKKGARKSRK